MTTVELFREDGYLRSCEATVIEIDEKINKTNGVQHGRMTDIKIIKPALTRGLQFVDTPKDFWPYPFEIFDTSFVFRVPALHHYQHG